MQIFLDTANLDQIKEAASWGILNGATTNPTLVSKENLKFEDLIKKICKDVFRQSLKISLKKREAWPS